MISLGSSRSQRNSRKQLQRMKAFLAVLSLLLLSFLGYQGYEYIVGKREAIGKQYSTSTGNQNDEYLAESKYAESFEGVDNGDDILYALLLGVDQRNEETPRTDTIMIAQYDEKKKSVKMASIMRDTYVEIPGHGYNKINAAFAFGGPELLRQTISHNFGLDMEYYSIIDFQAFTRAVDTLVPEGLEITIEKDMYYKSAGGSVEIDLKEGTHLLKGEELLGYVRFRSDNQGDFGRVDRQQKVIHLLKEEMTSINGLMKAPRMIGTIQPYIDTNVTKQKVISIGKDFLLNPSEDMETIKIPTNDNVRNERKPYPVGLVLAHDEDKTKETLQQFFQYQ
ncbi:LCP family protein [Halobacillus yeomjeoni]|uniref:LCP family protein n=1 Tax=Halobacillus yeomjeoni TaxID=311194 RepID=UPI0038517321